jgi:hypothetical protein
VPIEIFVDFGLFELLIGVGLAALARFVYTRGRVGIVLLAVSLFAPALLLLLVDREWARWVAAICVATSLVNAALIASLMRRHDLRQLLAGEVRRSPRKGRRSVASLWKSFRVRSSTAARRRSTHAFGHGEP